MGEADCRDVPPHESNQAQARPPPHNNREPRSDEPRPGTSWQTLAEHGAFLVALVGVLVYGILVLAYSEFYQELGINPADVGVDYGKALGGAAGVTLVGGLVAFLLFWIVVGGVAAIRKLSSLTLAWASRPTLALIVCGLVLLAALGLLHRTADHYADRIKRGQRVEPFRLPIPVGDVFDLELLSVRGEPTTIKAVDAKQTGAANSPIQAFATAKRLIYIGQAKGVAVIYVPERQQALYIPSSAALVVTVNCETRYADDDRCDVYERPLFSD
jgi:hypothetical protein